MTEYEVPEETRDQLVRMQLNRIESKLDELLAERDTDD